MNDSVTFEVEDLGAEVAGLLNDAMESRRAEDGEEIGNVGGIPIKHKKGRSMVHLNGVELPDRTLVYDKNGNPSAVPTAQLAYHLSKKTIGGERAFYPKPPANAVIPQAVIVGCERCGNPNKRFFSEDDFEAHWQDKHPREWASKIRKESQTQNAGTVEGLLKLLATLTPEQREALVAK